MFNCAKSTKNKYMTIQEVADIFLVGKGTIYRWLRDGTITASKISRKWLFDREYIENLMNTTEIQTQQKGIS